MLESQESGSSHCFLHTEISAQEAPLAHRLSHSQGLYPGLPRWLRGKEPACQYRRPKRLEFDPWVGKIPWRRNCQPTPVFLPRKFHGQRSLMGYSPRGHKESDTTERTRARADTHTHTHTRCLQAKELAVVYTFVLAEGVLLQNIYSMVRGNMSPDELMFILQEIPFQNILAQVQRPVPHKSAPPSQQSPTENYKILFLKSRRASALLEMFVFKGNYIFVCRLDHKMGPFFFFF